MTRQDPEELRALLRRAALDAKARAMGCRVEDPEVFRESRDTLAYVVAFCGLVVFAVGFAVGVFLS